MRFFLSMTVLLFLSSCNKYHGYICDVDTKEPIVGVEVCEGRYLIGSYQGDSLKLLTQTDEQGYFVIKNKQIRKNRIKGLFFKFNGYQSKYSGAYLWGSRRFIKVFNGDTIYLISNDSEHYIEDNQ